VSPIDIDGDFAHYYRFEAIARDRRLVAHPGAPGGFWFTGPRTASIRPASGR
jgi:hypothetical protein